MLTILFWIVGLALAAKLVAAVIDGNDYAKRQREWRAGAAERAAAEEREAARKRLAAKHRARRRKV